MSDLDASAFLSCSSSMIRSPVVNAALKDPVNAPTLTAIVEPNRFPASSFSRAEVSNPVIPTPNLPASATNVNSAAVIQKAFHGATTSRCLLKHRKRRTKRLACAPPERIRRMLSIGMTTVFGDEEFEQSPCKRLHSCRNKLNNCSPIPRGVGGTQHFVTR